MAAVMMGLVALAPGCVQQAASEGQQAAASTMPKTAFKNDKTAYDYFRTQGFTNFQAAGAVGNLDQESGIDPTISQNGGGVGRGIAQWSTGGRWDTSDGDNLLAFAAQENKSPYDLGVQLDFIMFELHTFSDYGLAKLLASKTLADATTDFELDFEGCGIPDECDADSRQSYAQDIFNAYGNDPVQTADGGSSAADGGTSGTPDLAQSSSSTDMAGSGHGSGGGSGAGGGGGSAEPPVHSSGCSMASGTAAGSGATLWLSALMAALGLTARRRSRARRAFAPIQ
jgi:Phage tail lysozyme